MQPWGCGICKAYDFCWGCGSIATLPALLFPPALGWGRRREKREKGKSSWSPALSEVSHLANIWIANEGKIIWWCTGTSSYLHICQPLCLGLGIWNMQRYAYIFPFFYHYTFLFLQFSRFCVLLSSVHHFPSSFCFCPSLPHPFISTWSFSSL